MTASYHLEIYESEALLQTAVASLNPSATNVYVGRMGMASYYLLYLL